MEIFPVIFVAMVWLLIALPISKISKAAKQQAAKNAKNFKAAREAAEAAQPGGKAEQKQPESGTCTGPGLDRPSVLQPSITFSGHDDSVYRGSLNAETGEGYDPCHEEQLAPLTLAETEAPAEETAAPGLQLSWTGSEVVRGFVMSEILTRKPS